MDYITHRDMLALDINSAYYGVPRIELMENAGRCVYESLKERFSLRDRRIAVYCGLGNNGGDGFVAARYLARAGAEVTLILLGRDEDIKTEEARKNYMLLKKEDVRLREGPGGYDYDIIVDALLGTGIVGELREPYKSVVEGINESKAFKISIDLPSGLSSETGRGSCVSADLVVTFHKPKKGLERYNYVVADIGIPDKAETHVGPGEVVVNLGKRKREAKKGDYGRVLILGGSEEYYGAPLLAAMAAQNSGVDLIFLAVPEVNFEVSRCYYPDFIIRKYPGAMLNSEGVVLALELAGKCDSLVIGPGLGTRSETKKAVLDILKKIDIPTVIDADALKALAGEKVPSNAVLTPHSAEFKLLTGEDLPSKLEDRAELVKKQSCALGAVILLKAPIDIIASPSGRIKYNSTGNPGMTVGGTGDVLAGLVGGFLAQGLNPLDAACCAAFVNGYAGDELYEEKGYSFTASDLAVELPYTIKKLLDFARL